MDIMAIKCHLLPQLSLLNCRIG